MPKIHFSCIWGGGGGDALHVGMPYWLSMRGGNMQASHVHANLDVRTCTDISFSVMGGILSVLAQARGV